MEKRMEEIFKGKQQWIERNTHKQTRKITDSIVKQIFSLIGTRAEVTIEQEMAGLCGRRP